MSVTIRDLAEKLHLSKSTVSYALNGGPKPVSAEVKARVLEAAREMGFRPNQIARSLAKGRTRTIGFVPNQLDSEALCSTYAQYALQTIFEIAHQHEMHVLLPSGYDPKRSTETRHHLFEAPVDGLIMLVVDSDSYMSDLTACEVPLMLINGPVGKFAPTINADNYGGSCQAIDYLFELGHRRIGLFQHSGKLDTVERIRAFRDRATKYQLEVCSTWTAEVTLDVDSGYLAGRTLLALKDRPTAVVCANDHVACGLLRAAVEMGIRIPYDLSVIGFDDDMVCRTSVIPPTTIRQPVVDMATAAFQGILDQIAGIQVASQVLPTTLIVRATTSHPPKDLSK